MPAFYHRPTTLEEVIDQSVNRALDLLGIELHQELFPRWEGAGEKTKIESARHNASQAAELVPTEA
jgi:4-hydroxy-3-polyprenylbenzoate decarboxylase